MYRNFSVYMVWNVWIMLYTYLHIEKNKFKRSESLFSIYNNNTIIAIIVVKYFEYDI